VSVRRIVSVAAILASLLAFAGVTPATAVGSPSRLAQLSGSGSFGFGQAYDPDTNTNVFVEVETGVTTFRPHTPGAPLITIDTGVVDISFDTLTDHPFGCWLIPKDELVVNVDLSATLSFDSSDPRVSECPGDPVGAPGVGPSGLVVGLQEPLMLTMTWTPAGPITSSRTTSRLSCSSFTSIGTGTQQNVDSTIAGSAAGTMTNSGPFTTEFKDGNGNFSVFSGRSEITSFGSPGCGPF
jgi:hypothetical protein